MGIEGHSESKISVRGVCGDLIINRITVNNIRGV